MKSICLKALHKERIFRDPITREKLERCKTSRVIQVYFEKIVNK